MRSASRAREFSYLRHDARGRDGDAVRHDEESFRVGHDAQGLHQRVEGEQRLARAHRDEVRAARRRRARAVCVVECDDDLLDHLARRERAQKAEPGRQAEVALKRTARLRREADGVAPLFGDEDGLDRKVVVRLQKIPARAVRSRVARLDRERRGGRHFGQTRAETFRQVGHLFERTQSSALERREDLASAVRRLAQLLDEALKLFARQSRQVCCFTHRLA